MEIEIIPPTRNAVSQGRGTQIAETPRGDHPSGVLSARFATWEANRLERVITARALATQAQARLYDAQTTAVESRIKRDEAANRLAELPEILMHERLKRRTERVEELRELRHRHELAEELRYSELARAQSTRVAAEQELQARRDYGYLTHTIDWKKKMCAMLDVELDTAERRALLRQHIKELGGDATGNARGVAGDVAETLHALREQMLADGIDTRHLDAVLSGNKGAPVR